MRVEFLQTVLSHLGDQVLCTSGDFAALLQTVSRVPVLLLAKHKILIEVLAVRSNEKSSTLEWCAGGPKFIHLGDGCGQGSGVLVGFGRRGAVVECTHRLLGRRERRIRGLK